MAKRFEVVGFLFIAMFTVVIIVITSSLIRQRRTMRSSITELHEKVALRGAELALQQERLRKIYEAANDGIFVIDPKAEQIIEVNPKAATMLGYSPPQMAGMAIEQLYPDEIAQLRAFTQTVMSEGPSLTHELSFSTASHDKIPVEISASRLKLGDQNLILAMVRDISNRKQSETEKAELHLALLEASREAGKAEVATGVLHNVGNILNNVNISASQVATKAKSFRTSEIAKVADLVTQHADDLGTVVVEDERGKLLPEFITQFSTHLTELQNSIIEEINSLNKNIAHIKHVVNTQQSYARTSGVIESVGLQEVMDDAIQINAEALNRHAIAVVREYDKVSPIETDRQLVLQILVNLISNAKDALGAFDYASPALTAAWPDWQSLTTELVSPPII